MSRANFLQQVSLYAPNSMKNANEINENIYIDELKQFRQDLEESCYVWPEGIPMAGSPLPVLVPKNFNPNLENLGDILCRAITSIIGRWWTDSTARFPERMPLLSQEEAILRWMDGPGKEFVPTFESQKGAWRPDFLFKSVDEAEESGQVSGEALIHEPPLQICEINARFAFNAFFICAFSNEVLRKRGLPERGLTSRIDPEEIFGAYENMIDISKPLHLLKGTEDGLDIHLFYEYLRKRRGIAVRFIKPADLRLIPDPSSGSGFKLYCISENRRYYEYGSQLPAGMIISSSNEILEEIHQVALELHQRELRDLGLEMLKALAPICFNDLRTVYLVHDKRMLGIVLQELDSLVYEHRVISDEEAEILRRGIVPTILPGSLEMLELLRRSKLGLEAKENYLLKPVGSGKGAGFVFGLDVAQDEWIQSLERLTMQNVVGPLYVVQEVIKQPKFEVFIPQEETRSNLLHHYFVGTFMMVNGKYLGILPWRISKARICAGSHGGAWIPSLESL